MFSSIVLEFYSLLLLCWIELLHHFASSSFYTFSFPVILISCFFCFSFPWLLSLFLLLLFPSCIISWNFLTTIHSISSSSIFSAGFIFKSSLWYLAHSFHISCLFYSFRPWLFTILCGFSSFLSFLFTSHILPLLSTLSFIDSATFEIFVALLFLVCLWHVLWGSSLFLTVCAFQVYFW